MKLENGYKKVYTVNEDGVRTLHATKDVLNPAADETIIDKAKAQTLKTANFYQDGDAIRYVLGANRAIDRKVDPELTEVRKLFVAVHVHEYENLEARWNEETHVCTFDLKCKTCDDTKSIPQAGVLVEGEYVATLKLENGQTFTSRIAVPAQETPVAEPAGN